MKHFDEAFSMFIFQRTTVHASDISDRYASYADLSTVIDKMLDDIRKQLPTDSVEYFFELESKLNHLNSLMEAYMYEQGLKDGVALAKLLFD